MTVIFTKKFTQNLQNLLCQIYAWINVVKLTRKFTDKLTSIKLCGSELEFCGVKIGGLDNERSAGVRVSLVRTS